MVSVGHERRTRRSDLRRLDQSNELGRSISRAPLREPAGGLQSEPPRLHVPNVTIQACRMGVAVDPGSGCQACQVLSTSRVEDTTNPPIPPIDGHADSPLVLPSGRITSRVMTKRTLKVGLVGV